MIRPYSIPDKFHHISESQDYEYLINAHALNELGHINGIGRVHPGAAKANRKRLELFDSYLNQGKQWSDRYSMPFYIYNAIGDFWYQAIFKIASFNYLMRLRNAGSNGIIYSGKNPDITLNDGRRSISDLRQLGIFISTTNASSESEAGHRYTLHTEVRDRLPKRAREESLFPLAADIACEYFWYEANRAEAAHIQYLERLSNLCHEMGDAS
jgi:hypothetical protein